MDAIETADRVSATVDDAARKWGPAVLRITAALLWLSNVSWKVPPDFGRKGSSCRGLCGYIEAGIQHPVIPGSAWVFEHIVSPNLTAFGWITIVVEVMLAAALLSGRFLRTAAIVGIAQSFAIMTAVANANGEWYWSYLLMMALHLAVLVTLPSAEPVAARTTAWVVTIYGALVAVVHAGAGFGGDGNSSWTLFGGRTGLPDDFGRNVFPGSIASGILLLALGLAAFAVSKLRAELQHVVGWVLTGFGALLMATVGSDGLLIGLGSRSSTSVLIIALGLALGFERRDHGPDTGCSTLD